MNMPQGINAILFPSETKDLESVAPPPILRVLRPATFALWFIIFAATVQTIIATGETSGLFFLVLATALFAAVHTQFWYEESERGRRVHYAIDRMRGRIYEDELTSLPNSRHFVFELRRQMMRSVRNGRSFSLVLSDVTNFDQLKRDEDRIIPTMARGMRQALGDGDFIARLQGPIFAAIVLSDRDRTATEKADNMLTAVANCIPAGYAGSVRSVVSSTGYEGELEVRDFLRRAQRDLAAVKIRVASEPAPPARNSRAAA